MSKGNWVHFLGSFPPRECGIATFTQDLVNAIDAKRNSEFECRIAAMNDNMYSMYNYPKQVNVQIDQDDHESYFRAADKLNKSSKTKLVCIQHEFGLFGGEYGEYLLPFLEELQKPVVTTFHSVIPGNPKPERHRKYVVKKICQNSAKVAVISGFAKDILMSQYSVPDEKIEVIPHGVPSIPFREEERAKRELGLQGKTILSTFGLMSRRKGIHYVIRALPHIVEQYPDALYLVIGETHPQVRKHEGEKYRNYLKGIVKELNLKNHVVFENRYVTLEEICKYIQATDVYITPYYDPTQVSSGTLAYAVASGTACVATPYLYARDVLRHGRGIVVKFKSSRGIADSVNKLLSNRKLKLGVERKAYNYTRGWQWPSIADTYLDVFARALGRD
ncbi:MAG: glycosyltransferase family 4 protein [Candidatus Diapherotrites archaeon]|uniref:Glycosyltransferase family 4 protein n=1 Tax=Candidatus Iainarchaeum sp. TaxID=3101447 RepID=A0A939CA00_9ARCH|nr:glycosyltransferase family 4 protein [Candidatus Diapherotrites archaeon]